MSPDEAAARGGGPERRAASGMAAEAAGVGPGHLQVHQHLRDPRVLHPARGGQRRLRPHPDMSRGTGVLCHSGSQVTDRNGSLLSGEEREREEEKKCEALRTWQ